MVSFHWIEKHMSYLTGRLGVYKLNASNKFFFEPTPGFYGFIAQGTTEVLNEAVKMMADYIESSTSPAIDAWEGPANPLVTED